MTKQTTREHLIDAIPVEQRDVQSIEIHYKQDKTVYGVIAYRATLDQISDRDAALPVIQLESFVVDYEAPAVRVLDDNSLWIPRDEDAVSNLMQTLARSRSEIGGSVESTAPPAEIGSEEIDTELALDREIDLSEHSSGQATDRMDREAGIDPDRAWGYGAGAPPEISRIEERLQEVGLDPSEHCARLRWGQKTPMDRQPRPIEQLKGNYGIEILPREYGLIAIDVDYPEEYPESEIPDTLEISSPHGSDEQRHILLRCECKGELRDELGGSWAVQGADWGDLWIGDRYVVGAGSQLGEYGCDNGDHERGEPGGCEECMDPEGGYYEILEDREIETVEPELILDLLDQSEGYELRTDRTDNTEPAGEINDQAPETEIREEPVDSGVIDCDSCGVEIRTEEALQLETSGKIRYICPGGCEQ